MLTRFRRGRTPTAAAAATLILGGLVVAAAPAAASSASASNDTVSVSGHGSVKATPDTLVSDLDAHAKRASAQDALDGAGQVATDVINALEANGVASKDIQTSGLSVGPAYDRHGQVTGYRADEDITARMHPLDTAGKALDAASAAGGNDLTIEDSVLTISNRGKYEAQARTKAFDDAKAAAEQYAGLAGRQLGRVEQIRATSHTSQVQHVPAPSNGATGAGTAAPSASIPVNPGKQTVSESVHVVWALQ
ncbi:MAG TPA: SIMPL domain-containing protein [Mycobacteriales bacterium]|nr:SIMPL domain-containing protein [Mycobacteriales bacterium]